MIKVKKTFILVVQADWDCEYKIIKLLEAYDEMDTINLAYTVEQSVAKLYVEDRHCKFYNEWAVSIEHSKFEGFLDYLEGCLDESIDVTVVM